MFNQTMVYVASIYLNPLDPRKVLSEVALNTIMYTSLWRMNKSRNFSVNLLLWPGILRIEGWVLSLIWLWVGILFIVGGLLATNWKSSIEVLLTTQLKEQQDTTVFTTMVWLFIITRFIITFFDRKLRVLGSVLLRSFDFCVD